MSAPDDPRDLEEQYEQVERTIDELRDAAEATDLSSAIDTLDQLEDDLADIREDYESQYTNLGSATRFAFDEITRDLEDVAENLDEQGNVEINYDNLINGDVNVEYPGFRNEVKRFISSFKGPGIPSKLYSGAKRTVQTARDTTRTYTRRDPLGVDDPVDMNRRKALAQGAGVGALLFVDYQNWNVDDSDCGGGLRFSDEPSGDIDGFGYLSDQEGCYDEEIDNIDNTTRDTNERVRNIEDRTEDGVDETDQYIRDALGADNFSTRFYSLDERQQRQLGSGFYQDHEEYLDEDVGRNLVEAEFVYRPGGDPVDSKVQYSIEMDDGQVVETKWFEIEDDLAAEFVGDNYDE